MSRPMPNLADLPRTVPLFPLPGALLLPRARMPLHIFEPRYLAMVDDCLKTPERIIAMIQPLPAPNGAAKSAAAKGAGPQEPSGAGAPPLHAIGCAGRLTGFSETEDGRYMLSLTGICRFRLDHLVDGFTPYLRGAPDWAAFRSDLAGAETDPGFDREAFLFLLGRYFARHRLSTDWEALGQADDELIINSMSMLAPLDPGDKQALLEAPKLSDRRETLMALMEFALHSDGSTEETRQ